MQISSRVFSVSCKKRGWSLGGWEERVWLSNWSKFFLFFYFSLQLAVQSMEKLNPFPSKASEVLVHSNLPEKSRRTGLGYEKQSFFFFFFWRRCFTWTCIEGQTDWLLLLTTKSPALTVNYQSETYTVDSQGKVWLVIFITHDFMFEENCRKLRWMTLEGGNSRVQFLAAGEIHKAILQPTLSLEREKVLIAHGLQQWGVVFFLHSQIPAARMECQNSIGTPVSALHMHTESTLPRTPYNAMCMWTNGEHFTKDTI